MLQITTPTITMATRPMTVIWSRLALPSLNFSIGSASSSVSIRRSGSTEPGFGSCFPLTIAPSIAGQDLQRSSNRSPGARFAFEREDALPVVLHADHIPAVLLRFVIQRLREGADLGHGQPLRRAVGVLPLVVVVQHQHLQPRARAGTGPLQHLAVAGRVAERRDRPAADHQVNAFRLAGLVVIEQELRLLHQDWLAVLAIAVFRPGGAADHLLGRNAVDLLGIHAHEILPAPGTEEVLEALAARVCMACE